MRPAYRTVPAGRRPSLPATATEAVFAGSISADLRQMELIQRIAKHTTRSFRGVAVPPGFRGHAPTDLDFRSDQIQRREQDPTDKIRRHDRPVAHADRIRMANTLLDEGPVSDGIDPGSSNEARNLGISVHFQTRVEVVN